jgi:hypothetical protein
MFYAMRSYIDKGGQSPHKEYFDRQNVSRFTSLTFQSIVFRKMYFRNKSPSAIVLQGLSE